MAKFVGNIGYVVLDETAPDGMYTESYVEHKHYGDLIRNGLRWQSSTNTVNGEVTINNQVSILADQYAYENFHSMKYVVIMGVKWSITNIEIQRPRIILTVGGVYNG